MRALSSVTACLAAEWRLKTTLSIVLTVLFCVPYFTLQHVVLFPVRRFELSALDVAVGFDPRWVWAYQSAYPLIGLGPWLATNPEHLRRYARGFLLLAAGGFLCFLLFPVAGPRPEAVPTTGMFAWLVWYDAPTNAFPSLHVGLAAYALLFGARTSRGGMTAAMRLAVLWTGAAWLAVIAYATLATKQHYAVDVPVGMVGAWLAHWWSWRERTIDVAITSKLRLAANLVSRNEIGKKLGKHLRASGVGVDPAPIVDASLHHSQPPVTGNG